MNKFSGRLNIIATKVVNGSTYLIIVPGGVLPACEKHAKEFEIKGATIKKLDMNDAQVNNLNGKCNACDGTFIFIEV